MNANAASTLLAGAPARIVIDLDAIANNAEKLKARVGDSELMAVVKADAYGHGLVPAARAAMEGGATWLGVAQLAEAFALRRHGVTVPILSWLHAPGSPYADAIEADVDLGVPSALELAEVVAAAQRVGKPARIHLKVDTGLARNGAYGEMWPELVAAAKKAQDAGHVDVVGVMTHFIAADEPTNPSVLQQIDKFRVAEQQANDAGLEVRYGHLANSAATLHTPSAYGSMVRPGLALYGLTPTPDLDEPSDYGLRPAMSVTANVTVTKRVPAGQGVSYGHTYVTEKETTLADIPAGYSDGVPRHASSKGPVMINGVRAKIAGRVCMDQFVVDMGDNPVAAGDEVVLFGRSADGVEGPTAQDWAVACDTINYEIVTRMSTRLPRVYTGELAKELGL